MKAWVVHNPGPITGRPLVSVERPVPDPAPGEVRVRVSTCGVCRTDLHLAEGDLEPHAPGVVPGHEIVGTVDAIGPVSPAQGGRSGAVSPAQGGRSGAVSPAQGGRSGPGTSRFSVGERIGIAWLRHTCGVCRFCRRGQENLCLSPRFTGWDADGGYSEYAVIDARFAYRIPEVFTDEQAAPLLCAGIIGFRALQRALLPPGGRLGIYGFGGSAHLAAQVAMSQGATVHVMTRSPAARALALELGVSSAGDTSDAPPEPLDSAIVFAPVGELVPAALAALDRGGTVSIAGIHLSDIPTLSYQDHLFEERTLRSVTANTRADGETFLAVAARIGIRVETMIYPLDAADKALLDLAEDRVTGAAVLQVRGA